MSKTSGRIDTFSYASSVDGTAPLLADAAFIPGRGRKPLLIVMHGYGGTRQAVRQDIEELALRGVVAVAPDMRGRGDSAGAWDSGGLDVHDILDAILAAVAKYPKQIDARNINIVGYSGGGGNAIACAVRFPDLFRNSISFFGISDYGGWYRSAGRPNCNEVMKAVLGGTPDEQPQVYTARNAVPAAANARCGKLHFFWDEKETQCPPVMIEDFVAVYRAAGLDNIAVHLSRTTDARRWIHNYRSGNPDLSAADDLFLPDVLSRVRAPRLKKSGILAVNGYLVTRRFQVWIGDGQGGRAIIRYDISGSIPRVEVLDNPSGREIRIIPLSPLSILP